MKYSKEVIKNIFYSNQDFNVDMQLIVDICYLLNNGLLSLKKEIIDLKKNFYKYVDDLNRGKIPKIDIDGGQTRHLALKLIGQEYLSSLGIKDVIIEQKVEGYRPDIITKNGKIIIECGDTNPDKIFNYFKNKNLDMMIIITYPNIDDLNIYACTFLPDDDLSDFLIFKNKEELKNVKKIINKRI